MQTMGNRLRLGNILDRASSLASEDSLGTNTTLQMKDSLSANTPRRTNNLDPNAPNVTQFAAFNKESHSSPNGQQQLTTQQKQRPLKNVTEIRLQLEEMRRQLAQRQQMEMEKQEQRRCETGKDTFFKVMERTIDTRLTLSGDGLPMESPQRDQQSTLNQTYIKSKDDSVTLMFSPPPALAANGSDSANNRSGGLMLEDATDPNSEMTAEMQAKRRAILASQIRRKERIMARSEEKETEEMDRLQVKMQRMEQAETRRMEREQRRQKLLENYKRKKMEQELMLEPGSARTFASSTISLNCGQSQTPPFGRPKSQSNMNLANVGGTLNKRAYRVQSNMGNNNANAEQNGGGSSTARAAAPSPTTEPSLKLFAKQQPKSNRGLIMNALQYSIFPGHVSNDQRQKTQAAIAQSDSKHFLVLFRDHQCQYRGLYTWDQFSDAVRKIEGFGPKICTEPMMTIMFKYDSGLKSFGQIPTKHLSATIDGFVIADQYWQKPKIPYSNR